MRHRGSMPQKVPCVRTFEVNVAARRGPACPCHGHSKLRASQHRGRLLGIPQRVRRPFLPILGTGGSQETTESSELYRKVSRFDNTTNIRRDVLTTDRLIAASWLGLPTGNLADEHQAPRPTIHEPDSGFLSDCWLSLFGCIDHRDRTESRFRHGSS